MFRSVVVSAGLLRIFGQEVAELPLVATSREHQGKVSTPCCPINMCSGVAFNFASPHPSFSLSSLGSKCFLRVTS